MRKILYLILSLIIFVNFGVNCVVHTNKNYVVDEPPHIFIISNNNICS
ncbi:hypothetical protein [Candidatus Clostridium radicumherbarum]|uniref:Uncharacterized protein n=1 Tax=Candidatus Clostridium radicumherbarum TaxID=3381662 RepID=A0ABW8TRZ4_9CLOT